MCLHPQAWQMPRMPWPWAGTEYPASGHEGKAGTRTRVLSTCQSIELLPPSLWANALGTERPTEEVTKVITFHRRGQKSRPVSHLITNSLTQKRA